ncbi:hypothetical protein [Stappia sp. MMSF_3263]|uniref:hypothetical protein n=1 Tax=Stappia sp. MMSF_3263 TaxID=3046693 RepID=UPI00273DB306|nr:hypothetical protein [Stappia sp. MMSF_3263]
MPLTTEEALAGAANATIGTVLVLEDRAMRVWHLRLAPGDTGHFPHLGPDTAFVHDLTNTGTTELVFVTVEFDSH